VRPSRWLAAALLVVAGCSPLSSPIASPTTPAAHYSPSAPAHRGGTAVFSDWEFPDTLNILSAAAETDIRAAGLIFSPLWGLDSGLNPYPDLVREVPTVENGDVRLGSDGRTMAVDVKLVPGLRWSDGQPITADDIIATWQAICDPATQAAATTGFDRIVSMDRKSDTEVVWNFGPTPKGTCGSTADSSTGVYAAYQQLGPVMWLMPKHRLNSVPHNQWSSDAYFAKPDVVSGPFTVSEVVGGDRITFVPNPHYADGRSAPSAYPGHAGPFTHRAYLDKVVYRVYPSKTAMLAGLSAGESDLGFHLAPSDVHALQGFGGSTPLVYTGLRNEFLNPNHGVNSDTKQAPPWVTPAGDDKPLLDALDRAIDRGAIVHDALGGTGRASRSLYPSAMASWADAQSGTARDLEGARRILDQDGWKPGPDGVRAKAGRSLAFTLLGVCDSPTVTIELDHLKQEWADLGAAVKTDCRRRATFFAAYKDGGTNATGAFDMTVYSNSWLPDPGSWEPIGLSTAIPSDAAPSGENWNRCQDPQLDHSLQAGDASLDPSKRRTAAADTAREWLQYHCTIPLYDWPQIDQVSSKLRNFSPNPGVQMDVWNAGDWWLAT
jgi:peptide/nickel transport system substrate-binding protein